MVRILTLYGVPGNTWVVDSRLAYINKVIKVQREGLQHDPKVDFVEEGIRPRNRGYYHENSTGRIYFNVDVPFAGPTVGRPNRDSLEKIFIIYETI